MAGLFTYSAAGLGFLLIAAVEALSPLLIPPPSSPAFPLLFRYLSTALLSALFILSSLLSSLLSSDPLSPPLPLSALAASSLFLLYSLSGLLSLPPSSLLPLPPSLLDLLSLFAFFQELLFFHLRRKDLDGIENRYFDLVLVPILVCAASTVLAIARPNSPFPRLARAAGLALHGTWFIQMGFSFFSSVIAHGCSLHERSRANFTITCKGHMEYHRGRAIATLQFNCHLAFLVVVAVGVYSAVAAGRRVDGGGGDGAVRYRPLNKELQRMGGNAGRFTLDSDEEEEGIKRQDDVMVPVSEVRNGFGGSH